MGCCSSRNTPVNPAASKLRIPSSVLESVISVIVGAVPTDGVYVFGSYARREGRPSSDVDIMVVAEDDNECPLRYAAKASASIAKLMYEAGFDYDLITRYRGDYLERQNQRATVDHAIATEGVKVYG